MRPIQKGNHPTNSVGNKIVFEKHGDVKPYLIDNTGRYCHFCEMPILNSPAVEHLKNKLFYPHLIKNWDNLFLICTYCNSRKPKKKEKILKIKLYNHYFPHIHNTFLAFEYLKSLGLTSTRTSLNTQETAKAQNTITTFGLDKRTNSDGEIDTRYKYRLEAISLAIKRKKEYEQGQATLNAVIGNAKSAGYWSVWFEIFKDFDEVKEQLIKVFKVPENCFDENNHYEPIKRTPEM